MREFTLGKLAEITGCELIGDRNATVTGVDELETAAITDVSFLANPKYKELLKKTQAGAICIDRKTPQIEGKNYLLSDHPSLTFQQIISLLAHDASKSGFEGIHKTAVVHPSSKIGKNVTIGPCAVIDRDTVIGDNTAIHAQVSIGPEVTIGSGCVVYPHVTIREGSRIGSRVILQPGCVIGGCGYGYITDEKGSHQKITHYGIVVIEDDVEIGANTTIDRARFKMTRIARGSKIDNLVMIGHNVTVGEKNLIVAQCGISGSTKTGRNVVLAGQVGLVGHLEIGDEVVILARGATGKSIYKKGVYGGAPAIPVHDWHKHQVHLKKLSDYVDRIKDLEEKVNSLEKDKTTVGSP